MPVLCVLSYLQRVHTVVKPLGGCLHVAAQWATFGSRCRPIGSPPRGVGGANRSLAAAGPFMRGEVAAMANLFHNPGIIFSAVDCRRGLVVVYIAQGNYTMEEQSDGPQRQK